MLDTLKTLCELPGVSGREEAVRDFLLSKLDGVAAAGWTALET